MWLKKFERNDKNSFKVFQDADGRSYIHQVIKECYKNHKENDLTKSNEAKIYETPGTVCTIRCSLKNNNCHLLINSFQLY